MVNDLTLEIKNVGPIVNAKIDIGKINIIGGSNSTGKSTASRLLYCFLKANASDRKDLGINRIHKEMSKFFMNLYSLSFDLPFDRKEYYDKKFKQYLFMNSKADVDFDFESLIKDFNNMELMYSDLKKTIDCSVYDDDYLDNEFIEKLRDKLNNTNDSDLTDDLENFKDIIRQRERVEMAKKRKSQFEKNRSFIQ